MSKTRIADRLGYYDENGQYVTHHDLTRKPPASFSKRVQRTWRNLNKPREIGMPGRKGLAIILIAFLLLMILPGLRWVPNPVYALDWHQGTHTTTTFWVYGSHDAARWNYNSTCINFDDSAVPNKAVEFQYALGYPQGTATGQTVDSYSSVNGDDQISLRDIHPSDSVFASSLGQSFQNTARNFYITSASFWLNKTGSPVGILQARLYLGDAAIGSAKPTGPILESSSNTVTMESLTNGASEEKAFTFAGTTKILATSVYIIQLEVVSATTLDVSNVPRVLSDASSPSHQGIRSQFVNSIWQTSAVSDIVFIVAGTQSNDLGDNCASASIILLKVPIGFGAVAGRVYVATMAWNLTNGLNVGTFWQMFLRTNGTLPSFSENYNPSLDKSVRMRWYSSTGDTSGTQALEIAKDVTKSLDEEGSGNDEIITQTWSVGAAETGIQLTSVLNFGQVSHPSADANYLYFHYAGGPATNLAKTTLEPDLDLGTEYFIGFNVFWDTSIAPAGTSEARLLLGITETNAGWTSGTVRINHVPTYCTDPNLIRSTDCVSGASITFDVALNPFNPVSWIIAAFSWVVQSALFWLSNIWTAISAAFRSAFDTIGAVLGIGALGTMIVTALSGVITWVGSVMANAFGQGVNIATAIANGLTAVLNVASTYWIQLTSWLSALSDLLSLFWPFIAFFGVGLPMSALITTWLILGIIMSYNTQEGMFNWMKWTWIATATIFNVLWKIAELAWDVILRVKDTLFRWL